MSVDPSVHITKSLSFTVSMRASRRASATSNESHDYVEIIAKTLCKSLNPHVPQ